MTTFADIQSATLAARAATGLQGIGTRISQGRMQVVNVTYGTKGRSTVDPLSDWVSPSAAVAVLRQIQADKGWQ